MTDAAELLTPKEYADLFRKNEDAVRRRIKRGAFTRYPVEIDGRSILIVVPSALVERLREGRPQTTPASSS